MRAPTAPMSALPAALLHDAHDLAHVLDGRGARVRDGFGDQRIEFGIGHCAGR